MSKRTSPRSELQRALGALAGDMVCESYNCLRMAADARDLDRRLTRAAERLETLRAKINTLNERRP